MCQTNFEISLQQFGELQDRIAGCADSEIFIEEALNRRLSVVLGKFNRMLVASKTLVLKLCIRDQKINNLINSDVYIQELELEKMQPQNSEIRIKGEQYFWLKGLLLTSIRKDTYYFICGMRKSFVKEICFFVEELIKKNKLPIRNSLNRISKKRDSDVRQWYSGSTLVLFEDILQTTRSSQEQYPSITTSQFNTKAGLKNSSKFAVALQIPKQRQPIGKTIPFSARTQPVQAQMNQNYKLNKLEFVEIEYIKSLEKERLTREENENLKLKIFNIKKENQEIVIENEKLKLEVTEVSDLNKELELKLNLFEQAEQKRTELEAASAKERLKLQKLNLEDNQKMIGTSLREKEKQIMQLRQKLEQKHFDIKKKLNSVLKEKDQLMRELQVIKEISNTKDQQFIILSRDLEEKEKDIRSFRFKITDLEEKNQHLIYENSCFKENIESSKKELFSYREKNQQFGVSILKDQIKNEKKDFVNDFLEVRNARFKMELKKSDTEYENSKDNISNNLKEEISFFNKKLFDSKLNIKDYSEDFINLENPKKVLQNYLKPSYRSNSRVEKFSFNDISKLSSIVTKKLKSRSRFSMDKENISPSSKNSRITNTFSVGNFKKLNEEKNNKKLEWIKGKLKKHRKKLDALG